MKTLIIIVLILVILSLGLGIGAFMRISALQSELSDMKGENEKLSAAINELQKRPEIGGRQIPLRSLKISVNKDDDHIKGDINAPITLIAFCDYESDACRAFHGEIIPKVEEKYLTTGKVRYVFKDFPNRKSERAIPAANAVLCAGEQDKYWEMQEFIFKNMDNLEIQRILSASGELGLNRDEFEKCVNENKYYLQIEKSIAEGRREGVSLVPHLFIGKTTDGEDIKVDYIRGARSFENLNYHIDRLNKQQ